MNGSKLQAVDFGREILKTLALVFVFDPHWNFRQRIENIEFGDNQSIQIVHPCAVTRRRNIEPTAAARTPCDGAVLPASLANLFALRTGGFGGERSTAHPCRVGLGHAHHRTDAGGAHRSEECRVGKECRSWW